MAKKNLRGQEEQAIIGLGSNLGNGRENLLGAWESLGRFPGIRLAQLSRPFLSAPVDMDSINWFTNAVGLLQVSLSPMDLLSALLTVEKKFGRRREEKDHGYQDRSLDLDLLYYGSLVLDSPELTLPHPEISKRLFVLAPLASLRPYLTDYQFGCKIAAMQNQLEEKTHSSEVAKQEIIVGSWDDTGARRP